MRIRLNSFAGMFPKVHPSRLQETASTQMQDMLLENGVLTPVTMPATALDGIADNIAQAWCHDVSLLSQYPWRLFDSQVSISRSPNFDAEFKRYYWSNDGKGGGLIQTLLPGQSKPSKDYKVGVPAPTAKPSAVCNIGDVSDAGRIISVMNPVTGRIEYRNVGAGEFSTIQQYMPDGSTPDESRSYVITYVNEFNEESAPSPPSDIVVCPLTDSNMQIDYGNGVKKTVRVDVTIDQRDYLNAESQGYPRITKLRIYRTNVASNGLAEFQFVAERDVNQSDSKIVVEANETGKTLPELTAATEEPPEEKGFFKRIFNKIRPPRVIPMEQIPRITAEVTGAPDDVEQLQQVQIQLACKGAGSRDHVLSSIS